MKIITNFTPDEYTDYVIQSFDLNVVNNEYHKEVPDINIQELSSFNWQIGLIVGNSGSGKTTLLKKINGLHSLVYHNDKPIISQFPSLTPKEATDLLLGVGLCSIPLFLQLPQTLSTGEFARFEIALRLYQAMICDLKVVLLDEFTSTVNRLCAKSIANSLKHFLMKHKDIKVVIATCHFDMIDELQPDWIVNMNKIDMDNKSEICKINYVDSEYKQLNQNLILSTIYEIL